jgi:hypothetical protein
MDANLTTAIATASGTMIVAIVAILSNNKGQDDTNARMGRVEAKLDHIESLLIAYCLDVTRIKEKLGIN